MKVRWKTVAVLLVSLGVLNGALYAAARIIFLGSYQQLQQDVLQRNLERASNALAEETQGLERGAADWSIWDDSWNFVEDGNDDFIRANLNPTTFQSLQLNALLFIHHNGRTVYSRGYDWRKGTESPLPEGLLSALRTHPGLWRFSSPDEKVSGVMVLPSGPLLLASRPVVPSDGTGPVRGALIMARALDGQAVDALAERTRLGLHLRPDAAVSPPTEDEVATVAEVPDLLGKTPLFLHVQIPRTIYRQGEKTVAYFVRWNLISTLAGGIALYLLLDRLSRGREKRRRIQARAEAELRESEERFRRISLEFSTVLNGIPDSLTLLDPELRIVWANRSTLHLWGVESAPEGTFCHGKWKEAGDACSDCPAQRAFATGRSEEGLDHTPDGRTWGVKIFPLLNAEGKVTQVIRLASDITEKLRMREETARNGRLAALGELSAGVAHEINNPNALILCNAPILQEALAAALPVLDTYYRREGDFPLGRLPYSRMRGEISELCAEIGGGAERIRRIVEDLKDFVRRDDGDLEDTFDLGEVLQAAVRLTAGTIRKSTDLFRFEADAAPVRLNGSAQRIEQVVVNLLMNACQALSERSQEIVLSAHLDPESRSVRIRVRDEGGGIAPEHLDRIQEPFFTTKRETGGTGLGLSLSHRIVRDHGGALTFDSSPGEGTTATLTLPLPAGG